MSDLVVFDLEIIREVGSNFEGKPLTWDDTDRLGIAVGCLWSEKHNLFEVYGPGEDRELQKRIESASHVVGFNSWLFDAPLLYGASREKWRKLPLNFCKHEKTCKALARGDILRNIWRSLGLNVDVFNPATHGGWGLDAVARATLGRGKTGTGEMAPKLFAEGKWAKVVSYCIHDVALIRDLYRFILDHGYVVSKDGQKRQVPARFFLDD